MPAVSEQVLRSVLGVIQGLPLSPVPAAILPRKQPRWPDGLNGNGSGVILVALGDQEQYEPIGSGSVRGNVLWLVRYPVSVAVGFRNQGVQSDNPTLREWVGLIWPACVKFKNLVANGLTTGNDVFPAGKSQFDPAALDKNADWAVKTFTVETREES